MIRRLSETLCDNTNKTKYKTGQVYQSYTNCCCHDALSSNWFGLAGLGVRFLDVGVGYHDRVGIPHAAKLKAAEDEIMAKQAEAEEDTVVDPLDDRIVGGAVSATGAHPYLVSLLF